MLTATERFNIKAGEKHKDASYYRSGVAIDAKERYTGWAGDKLSGFDVFTADFAKGGVYEWKDFYPLDHVQDGRVCKTATDAEHMWANKAVEEKRLFVAIDRAMWN